MTLSKRLANICEFVPEGSNVIDVGADHALVSIYLNKHKNCTCLATDISKECIKSAENNIKKSKAIVNTKVTDGLKDIDYKDSIIIISGMGTNTIIKILNTPIREDLIICSHKDIPLLRKTMHNKGYYINKEEVVFDKRYYVITHYKYGKRKKTNYIVSPFLIHNHEYMKHLLDYYNIKYTNSVTILDKIKYYKVVKKINKILQKRK